MALCLCGIRKTKAEGKSTRGKGLARKPPLQRPLRVCQAGLTLRGLCDAKIGLTNLRSGLGARERNGFAAEALDG